jgi:hypothetical protein
MKRLVTVLTLALMVGFLTLAVSGAASAKKQKVDSAQGKGEIVEESKKLSEKPHERANRLTISRVIAT